MSGSVAEDNSAYRQRLFIDSKSRMVKRIDRSDLLVADAQPEIDRRALLAVEGEIIGCGPARRTQHIVLPQQAGTGSADDLDHVWVVGDRWFATPQVHVGTGIVA